MEQLVKEADRDDVIQRLYAAAFDSGKKCEHCDGKGRVPGGAKIIASMRASSSWAVSVVADAVVDKIRHADRVFWDHHLDGYDLGLEIDGQVLWYCVPHPSYDRAQS